jgi:hypothetical protein
MRQGKIGSDATHLKYGQHDRIIGAAKSKRSTRVFRFGGMPQQRSCRVNITLRHKLLAAPNPKLDLFTIRR